MESGVAKGVKDLWPEAAEVDANTLRGDAFKLGTYTKAIISEDLTVVNAYTQYYYGRKPGVLYVDYDEVKRVMALINKDFPEPAIIGMPKIGAGLAQGDWKKIEEILNSVFKDREILVYEYSPKEAK